MFISWTSSTGVAPLAATSVHIEAFRIHCEAAGASPATVHRRLSALSSFYRHAVGDEPNPVEGTARPAAAASATERLAPVEAALVWAAACHLGPKTAAVVGLIMHDGMKSGEVLPLDVTDVRFGGGPAVVSLASAPRTVDRRTSAPLRRYVGARRAGPLFLGDNPTRQPARLTRFGVDYLVAKRAGVAAGLDDTVDRQRPAPRIGAVNMNEPLAERPHMPGYGIAERDDGTLPWSGRSS